MSQEQAKPKDSNLSLHNKFKTKTVNSVSHRSEALKDKDKGLQSNTLITSTIEESSDGVFDNFENNTNTSTVVIQEELDLNANKTSDIPTSSTGVDDNVNNPVVSNVEITSKTNDSPKSNSSVKELLA